MRLVAAHANGYTSFGVGALSPYMLGCPRRPGTQHQRPGRRPSVSKVEKTHEATGKTHESHQPEKTYEKPRVTDRN